jgi:ESCRT-II complex subunit VPS25
MAAAWEPPPLWSFPPFFTVQPNEATAAAQRDAWASLVVSWCAAHKTALIPALRDWPLWENRALARRLPDDGVRAVADALVASGRAEWADGAGRASLRVRWKSTEEWAALILAHADRTGLVGGDYVTVAELASGDAGFGSDFAGLEPATLLQALEVLAARGNAELARSAAGLTEEVGVKFIK